MKKPTYKGKELLPLSVIDAARDGDAQAVDQVLRYYEGYLRCTQLSLAYNFPRKLYSKIGLSSLSVNANVNNLFVIASKKWNGYDPELGSSITPKVYSLGLSVGF